MKSLKCARGMCALAIAVTAMTAFAKSEANAAANEPAYNPASVVKLSGTITSVRQSPAGAPMAGVHLTVKAKSDTFDVYVGPSEFMKMLKADFQSGDAIDLTGSQTKSGNANVILASELTVGRASFTLRDRTGAPAWANPVSIDPSAAG